MKKLTRKSLTPAQKKKFDSSSPEGRKRQKEVLSAINKANANVADIMEKRRSQLRTQAKLIERKRKRNSARK